ncbi:MAG TPA: DCC1-like thiol-disulfide oxidoreductase family protein [Gemmatimonadaceae bacterium]|nr:DCC1-like thiol-disulfide oxidoreductase family protein [Gemmatimonadaceae bacterium]
MSDGSALLLYDGTCGFCAESVQFVLKHDRRRRTLRFSSLQGPTALDIRARHPELDVVDSVIWFEPGDNAQPEMVLTKSSAVLRVLRYLGGVWRPLGVLAAIVPRAVRDAVYDLVARHRHRLVRGGPACVVPTPEERNRFLD